MKVLRFIGSILLFVVSFVFAIFFLMGLFIPDFEGVWIAGIFTVVFFISGIFVKGKSKRKIENDKHKDELKERGVLASSKLHHVEGLPLAEKTLCSVHVTHDMLIVEGGGTTFELKSSQIRAAEVKTDAEIANIVHSSAVKGVAGGLLFGPIGLVVGARATNKKQTTYTYYLIINFVNANGDLTAIMFDGGNTPFSSQRISNKLHPILKQNPKATVQL